MLDLKDCSLILAKDDNNIFSSSKPGLRPLLECVIQFRSKFRGCTFHDKVVGLAAARLIVFSGLASKVKTPLASRLAQDWLSENGVELEADDLVDNILTKDQSSVCPMESLAISIEDDELFYHELLKKFGLDGPDQNSVS